MDDVCAPLGLCGFVLMPFGFSGSALVQAADAYFASVHRSFSLRSIDACLLPKQKLYPQKALVFLTFRCKPRMRYYTKVLRKASFAPKNFDLGHSDSVFCHFLGYGLESVSKNFCHACTAAREPYQMPNGVGRCSTPSSITLSAPLSQQASNGTTPSPHTAPF